MAIMYCYILRTLKNCMVLPPSTAPYLILLCLAKSSALPMVTSMRSIVRKAARLAVYEDNIIRAKNHHMPVTRRVETALDREGQTDDDDDEDAKSNRQTYLGKMSDPCPIMEPMVSHVQLSRCHIFSTSSGFWLHG